MKINKKDLKEMIKKIISNKLNEGFDQDAGTLPEGVAKYSKKVDDFIHKTIKEARDLHEEGEEIMKANILSSYEVQERNRFILYDIGLLKNLAKNLIQSLEDKLRQ